MSDAGSAAHDAAPQFGQADLGNCEAEPIHLAAAVQAYGALLVVERFAGAGPLTIVQASRNAAAVLGCEGRRLIGCTLDSFGGDLADRVDHLLRRSDLGQPIAMQCLAGQGTLARRLEGQIHAHAGGYTVIELEPCSPGHEGQVPAHDLAPALLASMLAAAVQRLSSAASVGTLADTAVQVLRELTGYDRLMVYRFDPDGHGKVIAEARDGRLEPLLGHHYPASDIPRQARALYVRHRVRQLADVDLPSSPLEPARLPSGQPLDMSLCSLRSMSPIHLQYLRNMGVTASFSASLVRDGQLWGLVAAHHYRPRRLRLALRTAVALLAEVISTRLAAIENYAHAQVALMVRRLEQRLVEATSTEGDWRYAILRNPRTLLQPLEASGAVLFHDGEVLSAGEVPSTPELQALLGWLRAQPDAAGEPISCSALAKAEPALAGLTPTASGVLAVRLSASQPDYLVWLRKEQLLTVTWAGDPDKAKEIGPGNELSPRRSFAAWSEIVRGTATPWSHTELALARAIGVALVDIIVQVQAVRLLIAEHQLARIRATMGDSREPVLVADAAGRLSFINDAFRTLLGESAAPVQPGLPVDSLFTQPQALRMAMRQLNEAPHPWRRELELVQATPVPVGVRAEIVTGSDGRPLGFIFVLTDLRDNRRADAARLQLEAALRQAAGGVAADEVISAILGNASIAAMDIADSPGGPPVAPMLEELEASTLRATALYRQLRSVCG